MNVRFPDDLIGIPRSHNYMSFYEPLAWAVLHSALPGIVFTDEFTQINRPDVESASYPVILDHLAGFVEFSPDTMVVAAGKVFKEGPFSLTYGRNATFRIGKAEDSILHRSGFSIGANRTDS